MGLGLGVGLGVGLGLGVGPGVTVGVAVGLGDSVDVSVDVVENVAVGLMLLIATEVVCVSVTFGCGRVLPYATKLHMHNMSTRKREPQPRPNLANRVWA